MNPYYAAFLNLAGRRCVVLGGGELAARKAEGLLEAGAAVVVFAAHPCSGLQRMDVELIRRNYQPGDLAGAYLAIDCSDVEMAHQQVRDEAERERALLNVMDRTELCDFIAPALVKRGPLQVAVSTSGESPFLATAARDMIARLLGEEWGPFVALTGDVRRRLREAGVSLPAQMAVYRRLLSPSLRDLLRQGDSAGAKEAADAIVARAMKRAARSAA